MSSIRDIAKAAGVSVSTVSRALNGYTDVNSATRERIKQIALEMSYRPNALARGLVSKKTNTLAVFFSEMKRSGSKDSLPYETLVGIYDSSSSLNYDIFLFGTTPAKQRSATLMEFCKERSVEGAILAGFRNTDPYIQEILNGQTSLPCVLIDIPFESENIGYVSTNNVDGAKEAVNHLIELGHRRIAMINGHDEAIVSKDRLRGYSDALKQRGLPYDSSLVYSGEFSEEGGMHAMYKIMLEQPGVTAVFCASDLMAFGAIDALRRMGKMIPDDISIVGFDDVILSSYCQPSLTTIHQDRYVIGVEAAKLLVQMLGNKANSNHKVLDNYLSIRESTRSL